jgi:hypothetical protein
LIWCTRNYSAARHNQVVNQHRRNALNTFRAFTEAAAGDEATKNAVLLEATRSIFAPQPTGYGKGENEPQPAAQILEVFRGVTDKGEKP